MDDHAKKIIEILSDDQQVLVVAPPGTGKSTRLPLAILNSDPDAKILMLEPRRIAARSLATYISELMGESVGKTVGYHLRKEKNFGPQTRLRVVTEAMLLRYAQSDPNLSEFDYVILDEFHERNLFSDLSIAYLKQLGLRKKFKLVVMSATLNLDPLQKYLPQSKTYIVQNEQYPVKIRYSEEKNFSKEVISYLHSIPENENVLFFLPGKGEINYWNDLLLDKINRPIVKLHGELTTTEQAQAIRAEPIGKLILSTNVAESALTVDGVRHVIDSGEKRWIRFDTDLQKNLLEKRWISQSSAKQRAGRAQRQGPGTCLRLYSESQARQFLENDLPEILRLDLMHTLLLVMKTFGSLEVDWFDPPRQTQVRDSILELERLGAFSEGRLTELGETLSALPHSVHWSAFLLRSSSMNEFWHRLSWMALCTSSSQAAESELSLDQTLDPSSKRIADDIELDFRPFISKRLNHSSKQQFHSLTSGEIHTLHLDLIDIFRNQVAAKSKEFESKDIFKLYGSGSIEINKSVGEGSPEKVIVLSSHASKNKTETVQRASRFYRIDESLLMNSSEAQVKEEYIWNESRERVEKYSQLKFGPFVLMSEREKMDEFDENVGRVFLREKLKIQLPLKESSALIIEKLSHRMDIDQLKQTRLRLLLAAEDLGADTLFLNDANIWLPMVMAGIADAESLTQANWLFRFLQNHTQDEILEFEGVLRQKFPESLQMRTKKFTIHYAEDQAPFLSARIQEFFGITESVSIGGGKIKLNLHLLGPNMRALQVTQDLASFWSNHYPTLRKELQRRYPRHMWPENPSDPNWEKSLPIKR